MCRAQIFSTLRTAIERNLQFVFFLCVRLFMVSMSKSTLKAKRMPNSVYFSWHKD